MQKISCLLLSQVVLLLVVSSQAWPRQMSDDPDLLKRLSPRQYQFGLGKRSAMDDDTVADSYEDLTLDAYNAYPEKRAGPSSMYSFGLGKRNRVYGFGLGKRLESLWKYPSSANRQERRSKIYSFGLGKRSAVGGEDYLDAANGLQDKRAGNQRQFSFGLGKRDVSEVSHQNTTS